MVKDLLPSPKIRDKTKMLALTTSTIQIHRRLQTGWLGERERERQRRGSEMHKTEERDVSKFTSSMSWRRDFFNLRCSKDIKLVLKFQKLPLNNKSLGLKTVTNQGPMQSRESGCFHYITYLSINLESVSSLFKILYRKLSLEGRGVVVLIFLSWCISFWKKRDKMWELKNQFYRVE